MRIRDLLLEDHPIRKERPEVLDWLRRAYQRPDLAHLYLHGSGGRFDAFRQPTLDYGHLIFMTKLTDCPHYETVPLQAEYYGPNLYLLKLAAGKVFDPSYTHREANQILATALEGSTTGVWDREEKVRVGRLDYQDLHLVVPMAIKVGYNIFRVYEMSVQGDSYGVTDPGLITVVDRFIGR